MAWCHEATSHYLSQCWPSSLSPYGVTRPQWVKHKKNLFSQCSPISLSEKRRKDMKTSENGSTLRMTGHLWENHRWKGLVIPIFDNFFVVSLNKLLTKYTNCWWFAIPYRASAVVLMSCIEPRDCSAKLEKCDTNGIFREWRVLSMKANMGCYDFCQHIKKICLYLYISLRPSNAYMRR